MATTRVLLTDDDVSFHKLFGISQNKHDGSVYVHDLNEFPSGLLYTADGNSVIVVPTSESEKLSIHASGRLHVRHEDLQITPLRINGSPLHNETLLNSSVRHLFTLFPANPFGGRPYTRPLRGSDVWIQGDVGAACVFVFYAVPVGISAVNLEINFHLDELHREGVPPVLGSGLFDLAQHRVLWFAYRTVGLENWPRAPHVGVTDGAVLPLFIGMKGATPDLMTRRTPLSLQFFLPEYELADDELTIRALRTEAAMESLLDARTPDANDE